MNNKPKEKIRKREYILRKILSKILRQEGCKSHKECECVPYPTHFYIENLIEIHITDYFGGNGERNAQYSLRLFNSNIFSATCGSPMIQGSCSGNLTNNGKLEWNLYFIEYLPHWILWIVVLYKIW